MNSMLSDEAAAMSTFACTALCTAMPLLECSVSPTDTASFRREPACTLETMTRWDVEHDCRTRPTPAPTPFLILRSCIVSFVFVHRTRAVK